MASLVPAAAVRAEQIRIGGTGAALATLQALAQAHGKKHPETRFEVLRSLGSNGGIKAVLAGSIQLAVSSRSLKEEELRQGARQVELGRSPFAFAVARSSKVTGLSTAELVDIYAGKTEQWPDGQKIRLVLRPVGDTDSEMVKSLSPEVRAAKVAAEQRKGMPFAVSDQDAADSLEKIPGALGVITLAQLLSENRPFKALRLNQVEPSVKNIENGSYPLYKTLYLITGPASPAGAQQFVAFVQSPAGRAILQRLGYALK
ncbi:MAG: substrate-binding domain-containing protein [Hylemonella sp.]|nr:substrate-binding domain-containing protein [Hylemonella sp.]